MNKAANELRREEKNGVVYYRWDGIGVSHGFSTRAGGVSVPAHLASMNMGRNLGDDPAAVEENYRRFCAAIGADPAGLVYTKQIHSDIVKYVTEENRGETLECDALVTDRPGVVLSVRTADCVPLLFWEPRGIVSACHAGWRGTAARIQCAAVERMERLGACRDEIRCAIGASIHFCCYEVGEDFRAAVAESLGSELCDAFVRRVAGALHADLTGLNRALLEGAGLLPENIAVSGDCTCCSPELFFSHRASKGRRGVMAACICL